MLFNISKVNIRSNHRYYSSNNRSIIENNKYFPFKLKADFVLSYENYMRERTSFYLDLFCRKSPGNAYLLVVTVNDRLITTNKLLKRKESCLDITSMILKRCSESSIIKFELMDCVIWQEKCPFHFLAELENKEESKGSLKRSKLRKFFYKYKPVSLGFGLWPDIFIDPRVKSKYISPQDYYGFYEPKKKNKTKKNKKKTKKRKKKKVIIYISRL